MRNTVFILTFLSLFACVAAQPTTGKCGKNVKWTLQDDGTLVVEGAGDTYDYSKKPQNSPFVKNGISDRIKVVDLSRFHTDGHLSENLFHGCRFLEKIILRQSQNKMLSNNIFSECAYLTIIEYANNTNYSSKSQNNYYKIVQNTMNVGIPTVTKCIVSDTSKKEEDLFKPLEPFPPIESYDNLHREYFSGGNKYGQWKNGVFDGVVKTTWGDNSYTINYYDKGLYFPGGKCEYHYPDGGYLLSEGRDRDRYRTEEPSLCEQIRCLNRENRILIKISTTNNDCFIGTFLESDHNYVICDQSTYSWKNGSSYKGEFQDIYHFGDMRVILPDGGHQLIGYGNYCSTQILNKRNGKGIFYDANSEGFQFGLWENGKYIGSPEIITLQDFFDFPKIIPLDIIAKFHIEKEINEWQKKGEFESTAEWQARVTETTRQQKANELYVQLQNDYLENYAKKINLDLKLGRYDADNRTYLVTDSVYGPMIVSLENIAPQAFKSSWDKIIPVPTYFINGNGIDILEMDFMLDNKRVAHYQKSANLTYVNVNIDYDFNPIALPQMGTIKGGGDIVTGNPTENNHVKNSPASPLSDVDLNIPVVDRTNYNTHVFIIANENYTKANKVPYALKDGRVFKEYCEKTLGVLPSHIKKYENATLGDLNECVAKMKQVGEVYGEKTNIIFYYAGHAYADPSGVYLLPADGNAQISATSYSEWKLFDELGELPVNSVTCFIDACYSGKSGRGGVVVKPKEGVLKGKLVVISASSEDETADQYSAKGHGLFTYFLLKKLRDTKGDVTLGDLSDYIIEQVQRISLEVNDKQQTPTPIVSPFMELDWRQLKLNE